MELSIRLILPDERQANAMPFDPSPSHELSEMIDDDPGNPLFLTETCRILHANGVRFEIQGFFTPALPVSTGDDLVFLLEDLPGLLKFVTDNSIANCSVGLWGQGIETVFSFKKAANDDPVEITCSTRTNRPMEKAADSISRQELARQLAEFIKTYQEALARYCDRFLAERWNQDLFSLSNLLPIDGAAK